MLLSRSRRQQQGYYRKTELPPSSWHGLVLTFPNNGLVLTVILLGLTKAGTKRCLFRFKNNPLKTANNLLLNALNLYLNQYITMPHTNKYIITNMHI